jgi:hypothetical protein
LRALLRDTGDGVRVIVRLMQLGIKSGFEGRLRAIAQIDTDITPRLAASTSRSSTRPVGHACRPAGGQPFDFEFFTYYVDAQLIKTAAGGNPGPGLMSVQICHTEEQCEP